MSVVRWNVAERNPGPATLPVLQPDEVIADYLDHLCAPLVGVVPFDERNRLREEAAYHIDRLMNTYLLEGLAPDAAAQEAVRRYGGSQEVGYQFLEAWFTHQPQGPVARRLGLANLRALTYFGTATLLVTLLVQLRVYLPNPDPLTFGLSLAQVRQVLPEPLPLPDASPLSILLAGTTLCAPFVAGTLTGMAVPVAPGRAVYQVQTVLTLYTFVLGVQMLPTREGILLGLIQLFFWLPVGCL
ncbi:MAG: hypothetical protein SFU56_13740, partial [Capsulimonadales bacterium]|nr:hypothetical protein [Capsulimonadales bacterium]